MRYYQKHSFFPVVIILLTLSLAGFMFVVFRGSMTRGDSVVQEIKPVNEDDYRQKISEVLQVFGEQFMASEDNAQKNMVTQQALDQLLEQRVPAQYKDLHLQLAIVWNQLQTALASGSQDDVSVSLKKIEQLKISYPWLSQ